MLVDTQVMEDMELDYVGVEKAPVEADNGGTIHIYIAARKTRGIKYSRVPGACLCEPSMDSSGIKELEPDAHGVSEICRLREING